MKGFKTIAFNVAMLAVTMANVFPPKTAALVSIFGNAFLRVLTTTPVFNTGDSSQSSQ